MDLKTGLIVVAVVAALVLMIARRLYGEPLRARRLLVAPVVELLIGGYEIAEHGGLDTGEWISLAVTGVVSLAMGFARGSTLHLFERNGYLWQKYRPRTFVVWAVAFVARFGVRAVLALTGVTHTSKMDIHALTGGHGGFDASLIGVLLITSGLGFLGESMVLTPRALRTGVPFAPAGAARGGLLSGLFASVSGGRDARRGDSDRSYSTRDDQILSGNRRRR
ncbi:MAG: hypothetical protein WCA46_01085 [Actinocatenispora sp.]